MSFTDAIRTCLTVKYASFSGRARRAEYWWFSVLYVIATVVIAGTGLAIEAPLLNVLLLPFIVPMLTVSVRRLHDTGKSGRRMFIALIPVVGPVIYLVGMALDSTPGANEYGPSPKAVAQPVG
ncbi:DUF805 domain-containing protein [Streptomyces sp. ME02-8801-2C]|uniref:DUF805 domain-containing protein n=1 Tax=Streptomyces sp. ME02-8801-2C TaxID=3028680 RepID=UPI0029B4A7A9|nr:DUF805 domain-containing protein [Streptomyces sp. ME02-8801-2C]MDX3457638.1 DUF805 domain-containing protein [Streptomyces sp. ME02-8801-2C]